MNNNVSDPQSSREAPPATQGRCPREAVSLLEWLSNEFVAAFTKNATRRSVAVTFSRADHRRLRTLMAWLRRSGLVSADAFPELPQSVRERQKRGACAKGRCTTCGRVVAVRADGKTRCHRGSEACRYGDGQDVEPIEKGEANAS